MKIFDKYSGLSVATVATLRALVHVATLRALLHVVTLRVLVHRATLRAWAHRVQSPNLKQRTKRRHHAGNIRVLIFMTIMAVCIL